MPLHPRGAVPPSQARCALVLAAEPVERGNRSDMHDRSDAAMGSRDRHERGYSRYSGGRLAFGHAGEVTERGLLVQHSDIKERDSNVYLRA